MSKLKPDYRDAMRYQAWFWFVPVYCDQGKNPETNEPWMDVAYRWWWCMVPFWFCFVLETVRGISSALLFGDYTVSTMLFRVRKRACFDS